MKEREAPRCSGCPIHKAILNYSKIRFSALARNASDQFYTTLEPGGGFDEAEIGDWISKLEELRTLGAELSVERHR
jgi:hypothetical protein